MVDFTVEQIGDSPGDIESRLSQVNLEASNRTNQALMETARDVKDKLEETSPHDTGEYENSWYIYPVENEVVWILNEADHAPFVMLPNSRMVGSEKADLPTSGVLHNAEGVARGESNSLSSAIQQAIQDLLEEFSV
jgi:hypothetical protein